MARSKKLETRSTTISPKKEIGTVVVEVLHRPIVKLTSQTKEEVGPEQFALRRTKG